MADASITVELEDKVTGPAKRMRRAFTNIEKSMKRVKGVGEKQLTGTFTDVNGKLRDAQGRFLSMGSASRSAAGSMSVFGGALAAIGVAKLAQLLSSAVSKMFELGTALIAGAADAAQFAESLEFSLSKFLGGGADEAKGAINALREQTASLGLDFKEAGGQFKNFISAGATKEAAMEMLAFKADILALGDGSKATGERVANAFVQIEKAMATGKLELDGYTSILANLPVTQLQVMEKLAVKMKKPLSDLVDSSGKLKVEMTKLPVPELLESLREATLTATGFGRHGDAALEKINKTSAGLTKFISTRMKNAVFDVGKGLQESFGKRGFDALSKLADFAASPKVTEFLVGMGKVIGVGLANVAEILSGKILPLIQEFFESGKAAKFLDGVTETIEEIGDAIFEGIPKALKFFGGIAEGAERSNAALQPINDFLNVNDAQIAKSNTNWQGLGQAIGTVVGTAELFYNVINRLTPLNPLAALRDGFVQVGEGFTNLMASIASKGPELMSAAIRMGQDIIRGLVDGIKSMASLAANAVADVGRSAIKAGKGVLGIKSPSKVFEEMGMNTVEGFAGGLDSGAGRIASSAAGALDPGALMGAGGTTNSISAPVSASINISGAGDPAAVAAEVRRVLVSELAGAFEQINIEIGG